MITTIIKDGLGKRLRLERDSYHIHISINNELVYLSTAQTQEVIKCLQTLIADESVK